MTPRQLGVTAVVVALVLAGIVALLVTGGPPPGEQAKDPTGDVEIGDGGDAPGDAALADITSARVYLNASQVVFEAEMAAPIPRSLRGQAMTWRWEVLEAGIPAWIVSANVSVDDPTANVLEQGDGRYAASTIDQTLPGGVDYNGNTISVRLNAPQIKGFPGQFTWRLTTTLDANRRDPASATATDSAPHSGLGEYPPPA
ncbi:MAG: hypothetical protein M3N53_13600 [Actinomycetota bacterium]|nr:hypothetical protein [Actinomycetota bacterium]